LFDGFPRTKIQAYILSGLMIKLNTTLNRLISIEVPEEISIQRLLERGKTSGRNDDNEEVIRNRLREYTKKTLPVLDFYEDRKILSKVDGTKTIDEVTVDLTNIIEKELDKNLLNIVMFGYPGSGRGTQAIALAKKYGLTYIAAGNMLEEEIENGTEIGKEIKKLYDNGQLVPDEIVVPLIENKIENSPEAKGFIFKGFPRTLVQSYILEGILKKHGLSITKMYELTVSPFELVKRLEYRRKQDSAKPYDSSTAKILYRLEQHENSTVKVIKRFRKGRYDVVKIDGMDTIENIFNKITNDIETGVKNLR